MTVDVATYLSQLNDKKGKLERWETDVFQLFHAGVSYQQIADFLKLNGAEATKMEVYRFIHRKKRRHLLIQEPVIPAAPDTGSPLLPVTPGTVSTPAPEQKPEQQENASRPKFKFRESLGKEKPKW